jgi:hypothetical protein
MEIAFIKFCFLFHQHLMRDLSIFLSSYNGLRPYYVYLARWALVITKVEVEKKRIVF